MLYWCYCRFVESFSVWRSVRSCLDTKPRSRHVRVEKLLNLLDASTASPFLKWEQMKR